ncbi:hypothetical protein [Streptomyces sp. WAC 01529]|nr:hypothetical protein [Streptomyces sp. WAC 01529]
MHSPLYGPKQATEFHPTLFADAQVDEIFTHSLAFALRLMA